MMDKLSKFRPRTKMKVGDSVMCLGFGGDTGWDRIGLVLEFHRDMVLVFWGDDYPCEEEYPEQLQVVG